ncbi:MAG: glycosyltransferase family 4 protein [Actinobacteria bacterium]|nr:glycosyltransferase family 4 protein [Actinomycetota bacterium]
MGPQLEAFADAGYEVLGASAPGPYVAELAERGIGHVALRHATRSAAPHHDLLAMFELRTHFRRLQPDIVHTHNPKPGVYGRLAAGLARVPVVVNTVHGLYAQPDDPPKKRALVYGLERLASTCSGAELVQNPEDVPVLRRLGIPRHKLHLLGNGIDLAHFDPRRASPAAVAAIRAELGAGRDDVVCGTVGRLVWEKGYAELFAAATALRTRCPRARFVVVGPDDPAKGDAVPTSALEVARADGVHFLGLRRDMVDLYAAMDLFVLASHREGFPRSAMEAAAMGLPVVATDIRGCRQVVDHGATGLLVPPRDPAALADAVADLVADPDRRSTMGAAGREKARAAFDQQTVIDTTLGVYGRLLAGSRGHRRSAG